MRSRRKYLFVAAVASLAFSSIVQAQVTFDWPKQTPDISTYTTVEDCLGVIRSLENFSRLTQPRRDTIPIRYADTSNTFPSSISDAARRCGARFSVNQLFSRDTLQVGEMNNAYRLLLYAGRTDDARTFADRWLAAVPAADDTLQAAILSYLATGALEARPVNLVDAWSRIEALDRKQFWLSGLGSMATLMRTAIRLQDTVTAVRAARWLMAIPSQLPDSVIESPVWQDPRTGAGRVVQWAAEYGQKNELLDSLQVSTAAYLNSIAILRQKTRLHASTTSLNAKPLLGEFWFPEKPVAPRPAPGVISVILVTTDNECNRCLGPVAVVRRLHQRFPAVEFTLLASTRGYHGLVIEPPSPEREAVLIDSIYRTVHQLPALTLVQQIPFRRLPDPDRRRINESGPNDDRYPIDGQSMYLVDKSGTILSVESWGTAGEERVAELLAALLKQPR